MPKLMPCPFCGSTDLKIDIDRTNKIFGETQFTVTVQCMKCHARGPVVRMVRHCGLPNEREICEEMVAEAWNRRALNG